MATPVRLRTEILADPIAAWDELEAGITFLEEEIHAKDPSYVVTPFVPGQRTSTWMMTKAEIQGLEDRMHAVSNYLGIPHLRTVWSGLMPVNYNAMNHFILGLMPQKWIDDGYDPDGELGELMPDGYDLPGIDWISIFRGEMPPYELRDLITPQYTGSALVTLNSTSTYAETVNKTADGGSTWSPSTGLDKGETWVSNWVFLGNDIILCGFWDGTIKKSNDGGATWGASQQLGTETGVTALCYLGDGIVLAGTYPSAKIYLSLDHGDSWVLVKDLPTYNIVNSMCNLGEGTAVACLGSFYKQLSRTANYGMDWTPVYTASDSDYINTPVNLGNGVIVFVGLTDVYRSIDNGVNWTKSAYRSPTTVTGVPVMTGLVAGVAVICIRESNLLGQSHVNAYRTTDYGETWAPISTVSSLSTTLYINALIAIGETTLLAAGKDSETGGRIYRSTNSGDTWELVKAYDGSNLGCDNLLFIGA